MISETKWHGPVTMKKGLDTHAPDLISSGQEIELDGGVYCYSKGVLCAYFPQDDRFVFRSSDCYCGSFDVYLSDIKSITVLPVQKIVRNLDWQERYGYEMRELDGSQEFGPLLDVSNE